MPDGLGEPIHVGAAQGRVEGLMDALFAYLEHRRDNPEEFPGPILAGLAHHRVTDIHPFADGNGRAARTFAIAVLMREGYLPVRIFSFERHYAERKDDYFAALRSVARSLPNYTRWLEYFLDGLAIEYERVAERVTQINRATRAAAQQTQLTSRQEQIITLLSGGRMSSVEFVTATGASPRSVTTDLRALIDLGVVERRAVGRERWYRLAGRVSSSGRTGRPEKWTDQRIITQLDQTTNELGRKPSVADLRRANSALYAAIRRRGGLKAWLKRL